MQGKKKKQWHLLYKNYKRHVIFNLADHDRLLTVSIPKE